MGATVVLRKLLRPTDQERMGTTVVLRKLLPATGLVWALRAQSGVKRPKFGHFLKGRSLKGRCNIRVYVPVCVCGPVCVCVCVPPLPPPTLLFPPYPAHTLGRAAESPPHPDLTPHPRSRIRTCKQLRDLPLRRTTP